jgi:hypothetical protein
VVRNIETVWHRIEQCPQGAAQGLELLRRYGKGLPWNGFKLRLIDTNNNTTRAMPAPKPERTHSMRSVPAPIVYTRTRSVQVPEPVLREQRIMAGFDAGPFVDAFKILRTQVMHRSGKKAGMSSA